jgi:LPS O-antigen subunit length determinant protein (WzzB/FepE family)
MGRRLRRLRKSLLAYEYVRYLLAGKWFVLGATSLFVVGGLVYFALQREEYLSESEFIPPNLQKLPVQAGAAVMPGGLRILRRSSPISLLIRLEEK